MNIASIDLQLRRKSDFDDGVPFHVERLHARERQVAEIVYRAGLSTAKDVERGLGGALKNATVRSMLNRLVRKGVLAAHRPDKPHAILYAPAVTRAFATEVALKDFASDFCHGSIELLADDIAELLINPGIGRDAAGFLPAEVRRLGPRIRSIATVVYERGTATVREIWSALENPPAISGVRMQVLRLVAAGILSSRPSGSGAEMRYVPALMSRDVQRQALRNFISVRFGGSRSAALQSALQLLRAERERLGDCQFGTRSRGSAGSPTHGSPSAQG